MLPHSTTICSVCSTLGNNQVEAVNQAIGHIPEENAAELNSTDEGGQVNASQDHPEATHKWLKNLVDDWETREVALSEYVASLEVVIFYLFVSFLHYG